MKAPTKKEIEQETEKMQKVFECYRYLLANADDEGLRKKITDLGREHLSSILNGLKYSVVLPTQDKIRELQDELKKAKEREKKS